MTPVVLAPKTRPRTLAIPESPRSSACAVSSVGLLGKNSNSKTYQRRHNENREKELSKNTLEARLEFARRR